MAVKMALAVGLFIVICGPPGLKSSQVVPDGLIYTEVQKTVVRGVEAVLTCRFYGDPLAVYWRKGLDPDDLSLMVAWNGGRVSGPRFDDGSCDVDENYSLIIKNVSTADVGRIYCTVSNNKGPLMTNYTDILVLDTAITTNPQATLQLRQATFGLLQCTVHIKARRVSWKKGTTSSANESLVVIENNQGSAERSGAGYEEGTYNITHDYSLVIKELQIHHEGLYVCQVTDDTGISFRNQTFVNVFAQPLEPFPTIQECLNAEQHDLTYCTLVAKSGMTLTCQAVKFYPSINLVFLYGSKALEPSETREWNNRDGTKNKTITIATSNKELYTCVAFNTPGTKANKSTSVLLHGDESVKSTVVIIIVCCSVFAALILISSVAYFIWRKKGFRNINFQQLNHSVVQQSALPLEPEDVRVKELTKIEFQALEEGVNKVLLKHYRSLHVAFDTASFEAEKIILENRTVLFDTHRMLTDWQQKPTSTSSQNIRAFQHTDIVTEKSGTASDHDWPTNEELRSISRHLTKESMKEICKELQIAYSDNAAKDEGKRFNSLCEWRTKVSNEPLEEKHNQLSSVLESNYLGGLMPTIRGPYIYKAELVDLAFHLIMHDLLPIAKALGICITKLASYRPTFHPSHLEKGTIKLLTELFASIEGEEQFKRSTFCSKITKLHYQDVARRGVFEYDMSYGELGSITEKIYQNTGSHADQATTCTLPEELQDALQLTGQDLADGLERSDNYLLAVAMLATRKRKPRLSHVNYRAALAVELQSNNMPGLADEIIRATTGTLPEKLQDVLQLTGQDLADGFDSSHPLTAHAMLKIWKEKPRTSVFNYRAALAHDLRINEMPGLADEIIGGKYMSELTSLAFIRHLVQGLNQDQKGSLREQLQLKGKREQWHTTTPFNTIAKQIYVWVAGWTTNIKGPAFECSRMANPTTCIRGPGISAASAKTRAEEHRDLNDKLVEHGFLDLAREIMIIEQQLKYGL